MNNTMIQKEHEQADSLHVDQTACFTPLVDIVELNDAFIFKADLPGVKASDLDITFENRVLTIAGKVQPRQPVDKNFLWKEYGVGHYYRQFTLNMPVDADGIKAELRDGALELHVPKAASSKTRKIEIKIP